MSEDRLREIQRMLLEAARDDVERKRHALELAEAHLSRMESSQEWLTSKER